jgi:energy-coupling factor transporter ATP-binding protein EcfA2
VSEYDLFEYIQGTYRGANAYADSLSDSMLKKIHIETALDEAVSIAIAKGNSIVLTGNPGDGKTHLLRVLAEKIRQTNSKAVVELDASEKLNDELIKNWKTANKNNVPFCIAINEAVLFELAQANPSFSEVVEAQRQVEEAVVYLERSAIPSAKPRFNVVVFDLSRRNILSNDVVQSVFSKFSSAKIPPEGQNVFEIAAHAALMKSNLFQERLQILFDRISRRGFHCTLRELQGFVGFLLGKGLSPIELAEFTGNKENFLTELIFSGEGALFDALRKGFDPKKICHPIFDTRIVTNEIEANTWEPEEAQFFHSAEIDDVEEIERRRRRFYFFNEDGIKLLEIARDADSAFSELLDAKNERDVLRELIPKINNSFCFQHANDEIRVWKSHRYDHETERMLYSTFAVKRRDLEVLYPNLSITMSAAFQYVTDHIVIQVKNQPQTRLLIDFEMYQFLSRTEFGSSVVTVANHLTRRLWKFMERLSVNAPLNEVELDAKILDLQTGELLEVVIDTEESRYLSMKSIQ